MHYFRAFHISPQRYHHSNPALNPFTLEAMNPWSEAGLAVFVALTPHCQAKHAQCEAMWCKSVTAKGLATDTRS